MPWEPWHKTAGLPFCTGFEVPEGRGTRMCRITDVPSAKKSGDGPRGAAAGRGSKPDAGAEVILAAGVVIQDHTIVGVDVEVLELVGEVQCFHGQRHGLGQFIR